MSQQTVSSQLPDLKKKKRQIISNTKNIIKELEENDNILGEEKLCNEGIHKLLLLLNKHLSNSYTLTTNFDRCFAEGMEHCATFLLKFDVVINFIISWFCLKNSNYSNSFSQIYNISYHEKMECNIKNFMAGLAMELLKDYDTFSYGCIKMIGGTVAPNVSNRFKDMLKYLYDEIQAAAQKIAKLIVDKLKLDTIEKFDIWFQQCDDINKASLKLTKEFITGLTPPYFKSVNLKIFDF